MAQSATRSSAAAVAQRISSQAEFPLIFGTPYTLEGALVESEQARVITEVGWRNRVVHVNKAWEDLYGYKLGEVEGSLWPAFVQVCTIMAVIKSDKGLDVMSAGHAMISICWDGVHSG